MAKKPGHIHKYHRLYLDKKKTVKIYACAIPNCSHYIPERLAVGKLSKCNFCEDGLTLIRRERDGSIHKKPLCDDCRARRRKGRKVESKTVDFASLILGSKQ